MDQDFNLEGIFFAPWAESIPNDLSPPEGAPAPALDKSIPFSFHIPTSNLSKLVFGQHLLVKCNTPGGVKALLRRVQNAQKLM